MKTASGFIIRGEKGNSGLWPSGKPCRPKKKNDLSMVFLMYTKKEAENSKQLFQIFSQ